MLVCLIIAAVIGLIVSGVTGIGILGWAAGILFFIFGLPGALIASFIHGEVSYAEDRADYRETMSEIAAADLAGEHEYAEDARIDRLVDAVKRGRRGKTYADNRQVHIHGAQV